MKPNEDALSAEQQTANDEAARRALVESSAMTALVNDGATALTLLMPHVVGSLKAVHVGDGELRVYAVDGKGNVKYDGAGRPMDAAGLVRELRTLNPTWNAIAWTK